MIISTATTYAQFLTPWAAFYPPTGDLGPDEGVAVATDARGNTYVTGWSTQTTGGINIVTAKYSPSGALIWDQPYIGQVLRSINRRLSPSIR
jgi:hypothetical protein